MISIHSSYKLDIKKCEANEKIPNIIKNDFIVEFFNKYWIFNRVRRLIMTM